MRDFLKSPLFIALVTALTCASLFLTEPVEHIYWTQHNKLHTNQAPRDVVVVSLDGGSGRSNDRTISSTARQALLLNVILAQQPRHVFFDMPTAEGVDENGDRLLDQAIARGGAKVTMVVRASNDASAEIGKVSVPETTIAPQAQVAVSAWRLNFSGYARDAPPALVVEGRSYPAVAAVASGTPTNGKMIVPDLTIDPESVMVIDSGSFLYDSKVVGSLAGKTVFVTTTNPNVGTSLGYFGHGRVASVMADIAAISGMKQGTASDIGKWPYLALFTLLIVVGNRSRRLWVKHLAYASLVASLLLLPAVLLDFRIVSGSSWGIVAFLVYAPFRLWQRRRRRVELTNSASGLPNIEALAADGIPAGYDIVAAAIGQYEQMLASLPRELHGECARQIARRLSVASGDSKIYVTDNGHFVWLEQPRPTEAQVNHLEGLKALFSAPLVIGGTLLDTNIHFGLDRISSNPPMRRIQAALASAGEAAGKGKLYEEFEQRRLAEAPWELSLHARIDEGLRNGDIWLALQPQLDIRNGRISGAEALIRWNDPERGAIPPDAFILAAERAGRIEAITYWVLERAIEASAKLNMHLPAFHISINLSARMADHPELLSRVRGIVDRYGFDCTLMTFEVTETFSMANRDVAKVNLYGLREMGFRLSIDDFGTGQASLAYLAEIPSDEIKLDKCFIQAITHDRRGRVIVRTVIKLAHALGQEIVAEGVEDQSTLDALKRMNCDIAQGYHIGRPMRLDQLVDMLGQQPVTMRLVV